MPGRDRLKQREVNVMEVLEAIKTRPSIRHYKPDAISEEKLNAVLEAARWAPSRSNTQCWRFIVVKDKEVRARLAETLRPGNPAYLAVKEAPIVIVACAELSHDGFIDGKQVTDSGDWYMFDVALAMQNLTLAAHSLGLGTVHIAAFNSQEVTRILKIPQGVAVVEMTPLGYPAKQARTPLRKELSELVFRESYGQNAF